MKICIIFLTVLCDLKFIKGDEICFVYKSFLIIPIEILKFKSKNITKHTTYFRDYDLVSKRKLIHKNQEHSEISS